MSWRPIAAEALGTFILVLLGVGTAVIAGGDVGNVGVSLAFGLTLLALAFAIGPISGCHVNPAVTLGLVLGGRTSISTALGYWGAQVAGAIAGAGVLLLIADGRKGGYDAGELGLGANGYGAHSPGGYELASAFTAEVLLTALLVLVVLGATHKLANTEVAAVPIGFVLVVIHLMLIPITNASVNPARSIGPALFVGDWALSQLWLFIAAPLIGAAVAAGAFALIGPARDTLDTGT